MNSPDEADVYKDKSGCQRRVPGVNESKTKQFLNKVLPSYDRHQIDDELKKRYILGKHKKQANNSQPRKRKTQLSLSERRRLGLYKLPRLGLKYDDYIPLHELWCDYMRSYIELEEISKKRKADDNISLQLLKADFHGAIATVARSRCPSLVGTSGILLMDTKNTFKLISKDNIVRTIPKENSMFTIHLDGIQFTIFGKSLQIKPIERSTKKIKNRKVADL